MFNDASFAPDGTRSQQDLLAYYDGNLVTWASMRQAFITMSTAESELVTICEGVTALKSLEGLVAELETGDVTRWRTFGRLCTPTLRQLSVFASVARDHGEPAI